MPAPNSQRSPRKPTPAQSIMPATRRKSSPRKPTPAQRNFSAAPNSRRGPRVIVDSPFANRPPIQKVQGHDALCLVIMLPDGNQSIREDGLKNCWCMCVKCWDRQGARCICRYCPCPSSQRLFL